MLAIISRYEYIHWEIEPGTTLHNLPTVPKRFPSIDHAPNNIMSCTPFLYIATSIGNFGDDLQSLLYIHKKMRSTKQRDHQRDIN